jgi:hypothetical protein
MQRIVFFGAYEVQRMPVIPMNIIWQTGIFHHGFSFLLQPLQHLQD